MAVSRKTVTVLFADVADSTGLGERLDPEAVRGALGRWFDLAREIIERHGGTVEKFIGDAVMAVFGVPQLHEDDAVRAVRAADELLARLAELNAELERRGGVALRVRVGVNTGEVVAGDGGGTLVTGDAVNVAKRLEEAAQAGEVLLGAETLELVRATGRFEPLGALPAKGKQEPVAAWRIVSLDRTAPPFARRFETPLVGRRRELEHLQRAYGRAVHERTCHLFTLLGPAGIGKSRVATELFDVVARDATILVGRCLPYGDGITFWPVNQILRQLGGDAAIGQLVADCDDAQLIAERLAGLTGRAAVGTQETFWAVRRVCEELARRQPLVLSFEDVHWAEPTLLDLVEYLAGWIHDVPMLLLCLARPEFLEERPQWLAAGDNAASLTLQPLSSAESEQLLEVLGTGPVGRERIVTAAEGNPLYVEQMAAMVAEGGYADGLFRVPPTIQTLLAARLDRLAGDERAVLERAAVCGREFWRGAIVHLTPPEARDAVGPTLLSLVRKELIKPSRSTRRADDAFRFAHALVRDAAYARISKEARATLHEEFAMWLGASADDTMELDELLGYHFEQAVRARHELGFADEQTQAMAARASALLAAAGHRAFERRDVPAARRLLERAAALLEPEAASRAAVLTELGAAVSEGGEPARAAAILDEAVSVAERQGDEALAARARIERSSVLAILDPSIQADDLREVAEQAVEVFSASGDDAGLATALTHLAEVHWMRCRYREMQSVLERALEHAERGGSSRTLTRILGALARAAAFGPLPVDDGIELCRSIRARAHGDASLSGITAMMLALLEAMRGNANEARALCTESRELLREVGLSIQLAAEQMYVGWTELIAGDPVMAERELRLGCELLERMGETSFLSTTAGYLAHALYDCERYDEANEMSRLSQRLASTDDLGSQVLWRGVRAKVDARAGDAGAIELARGALRLARETDFVELEARSLEDLAETLHVLDEPGDARAALADAIRVHEAKGNIASAQRLRATAWVA